MDIIYYVYYFWIITVQFIGLGEFWSLIKEKWCHFERKVFVYIYGLIEWDSPG